jgi:hypothetical protein
MQRMKQDALAAFVESDMNNVLELFGLLNEGTHGAAGAFDFARLQVLRTRVAPALGYYVRTTYDIDAQRPNV